MDKRTLGAFLLIGAVFLIWSIFFTPKPEPAPPSTAPKDSTGQIANTADTTPATPPQTPGDTTGKKETAAPLVNDEWNRYRTGGSERLTISTPLYTAELSSRGALLSRFTLTKYKTWYGDPVQLINDSAGFPGELALVISTPDGKEISTSDFSFSFSKNGAITLKPGDSLVVIARIGSPADSLADSTASPKDKDTAAPAPAPIMDVAAIEKRFVFYGDRYDVGLSVAAPPNAASRIEWRGGLKYQEHNSVDESSKAEAYAMVDETLHSLNADVDEPERSESHKGNVAWVATKTKYFTAALIPTAPLATTATLSGSAVPADSNGLVESYRMAINLPAATTAQSMTLLLGPLEFEIARDHNLTGMISYGFLEFMVRPISEWILLPIFRLLHSFISNWGLVIIIFSILIRGALWPLSIPQIRSAEKMRLIQPVIAEMRETYKDDQQKQQMETMKVYREYGVNPVGGCLPLILQLPILYALWTTLSNAIDLRQADFAFWIHDLSVPDALIHLPFSLPLLGSQISGLAIVMGATLFIQQSLMITDPKQRMMIYIMPVFLTIAFNYFPAGLNLYYLTFNLLSIGQHYYMRNYSKSKLTLDDLKTSAKGKKAGWISKKLEEAQKIAEMQGRVPPGSGKGAKK